MRELALKQGVYLLLVAHTGFEPVISSLRGRCPKPLDECATKLAGEEGFEPSLTDSESVVLPLDYSPVHLNNITQSYTRSNNKDYLTQQA